MTEPRKDGLTWARTDMPAVGDVIAVFEDQIKAGYSGPYTVVAVDPARPRIRLLEVNISDNGIWGETFLECDGGTPPFTGGPPYYVLRWNLLADLTKLDRVHIDKHMKWLAKNEPEARRRKEEWDAAFAAYRASKLVATA